MSAILAPLMISDSLLRLRLLVGRLRWVGFVSALFAVLKLKDALRIDDRLQIHALAIIGLFALVAALDQAVLRNRGRRLRVGLYATMMGDLAVLMAASLLLPLGLTEFPVIFLAAIAVTAVGLGFSGGVVVGLLSSLAVVSVLSVRGEPLSQGMLFWPAVFISAGMAAGYAVEKWDLAQQQLERASYWIARVNAAMTMAEIGDAILDYLASAAGSPADEGKDTHSFAGAFLLLDPGQDRYYAVATRELSADEAARLWLPASHPMLNWALQRREPLWVSGGESQIPLPRIAKLFSSVLLAPLATEGKLLGAALLFISGKNAGSKEVLGGMARFCQKAAEIIEQTAFHSGLAQQAQAAEAILATSHSVESEDADQILTWAVDAARQLLRADLAAVAISDAAGRPIIRMASHTRHDFVGYDLADGSTFVEWVLKTGDPVIVHDCTTDPRVRRGSLLEQEVGSLVAVPLRMYGDVQGVLLVGREAKRGFAVSDVRLFNMLGRQVTLLLERARRLKDGMTPAGRGELGKTQPADSIAAPWRDAMDESRASVVRVLSLAVEGNKPFLEGSSQRVAGLAVAMGVKMNCPALELKDLEHSALLRDVGMITIEPGLLDRAGSLTEPEMARVRQHTLVGQAILSSLPFVWNVPAWVRHHHERYDGQGYPDCLKGDQIPLCSRILAVADVFDALTSKRPHRPALSPGEAGEMIARGAGSQFDPAVVEAFQAVYRERFGRANAESRSNIVRVLSLVVEANKGHANLSSADSKRVASLAVALGERMGCTPAQLRDLEHGALLRDVGCLGLDLGLLERPGALTEGEMARVRQHPAVGQAILSSLPLVWDVPAFVRHHHERYDGAGYPDGLKEAQIPLGARILALADVFDALTSSRPYRAPLSPKDAWEVVAKGSGSQFDPVVVEAFRAVYSERYDVASWLSGSGR